MKSEVVKAHAVRRVDPDMDVEVLREEIHHSLFDGRARWPDGTLRNGQVRPTEDERRGRIIPVLITPKDEA